MPQTDYERLVIEVGGLGLHTESPVLVGAGRGEVATRFLRRDDVMSRRDDGHLHAWIEGVHRPLSPVPWLLRNVHRVRGV